jgi:hypothetical protein
VGPAKARDKHPTLAVDVAELRQNVVPRLFVPPNVLLVVAYVRFWFMRSIINVGWWLNLYSFSLGDPVRNSFFVVICGPERMKHVNTFLHNLTSGIFFIS